MLTAAVIAYGSTGDSISSTVFGYVDWLNIMDYDNTNGVGQSTYSSAVTAFDYWVGTRGLSASKANLGVPFYSDPSDYAFWDLLQRGASATAGMPCSWHQSMALARSRMFRPGRKTASSGEAASGMA